jgi:hypothetical protein
VLGHVGGRATAALRDARRVASLCDLETDDPVVRANIVADLRRELDRLGGRLEGLEGRAVEGVGAGFPSPPLRR